MKPKGLVLILLAAVAIMTAALVWRRSRTPKMNPPVGIQDGKTIDFSSGKPETKDSAKEKAIIDAAVKEMDEANKNVTFGPTATPAAPAPAK